MTWEQAIEVINISFNVMGVLAFAYVCFMLLPPILAGLAATAYCFTNIVWFTGLVHLTNAASTFFAPGMVACLLMGSSRFFLTACALWALGAGFRPSDGVFLLPLLIWGAFDRSWRDRITGLLIVVPLTLIWWTPTMEHFGGSLLAPIQSSATQVSAVNEAVSPLRVGLKPQGLANLTRLALALITSFHILIPLALVEAFQWDKINRMCLLWAVPGALFLALAYMGPAPYIAYFAGGILLLAFRRCSRMPPRVAIGFSSLFIIISVAFMLTARPVEPSTFPRRVLDAYSLQNSAAAVRDQYFRELSELEVEAAQKGERPSGPELHGPNEP